MVLRDPTIAVAMLEIARDGILCEGFGFDRWDIGAVVNVTADHLGLERGGGDGLRLPPCDRGLA